MAFASSSSLSFSLRLIFSVLKTLLVKKLMIPSTKHMETKKTMKGTSSTIVDIICSNILTMSDERVDAQTRDGGDGVSEVAEAVQMLSQTGSDCSGHGVGGWQTGHLGFLSITAAEAAKAAAFFLACSSS